LNETGSRLFSKIVISPRQRCIHVMLMFSPEVIKQPKIFNDQVSEMTK